MELPQLNISFKTLAETASIKAREELKPRNPKFKIGEELKYCAKIIGVKDKEDILIINIKIKDMKYSPTLEDNICIVTILDTVGQVEDYITEKDLIENIYKEVN